MRRVQAGLPADDLIRRFEEHLHASEILPRGAALTLALSGGVDSMVLLDLLLRLRADWGWRVSVAHYDHRMRAGSAGDARWVAELCDRLGVSLRLGRAPRPPRNEADARRLRYGFLRQARDELGAGYLLTAHQADDQAETVLFRLLRGTGMRGLAGIPARRRPSVVRPLLPFWRSEIEMYARARRIVYREDPTNRRPGATRNRIRHRLIPAIESALDPRLRPRLVRLARLARRAEAAVRERVESAAEALVVDTSESRIVVARNAFSAYDETTRAHLLRALVARVGPRPGRVGTRLALEFISRGQSGREIELAGGIGIRREFEYLYIERRRDLEPLPDVELTLPAAESGAGEVRIAGLSWRVRWALDSSQVRGAGGAEETARFDPTALRFPLTLRAWRPGDRIRLPGGGRKLKRLFLDRRVGVSRRASFPVLVDGEGVLWVVGLALGVRAPVPDEGPALTVALSRRS